MLFLEQKIVGPPYALNLYLNKKAATFKYSFSFCYFFNIIVLDIQ